MLNALRGGGFRVEWLLNLYGADRDALLARSKIVINMHQHDAQVFEIVRVSYLLANRRTVVSERGALRLRRSMWSRGSRSLPTTTWSIAV